MSKETTVIALGIWIIIAANLGVPSAWRTGIVVLSGAVVACVGFLLRGERLSEDLKPSAPRPFVESAPPQESAEEKEESASFQ